MKLESVRLASTVRLKGGNETAMVTSREYQVELDEERAAKVKTVASAIMLRCIREFGDIDEHFAGNARAASSPSARWWR